MRAAPPFQVSLQHFGVWRVSVWVITAIGVAMTGAWLVTRGSPLWSTTSLAALLTVSALAAIGRSLAGISPADLRWDGRCWHLGPPTGEPIAGDLRVAIDFGAWMLLCFAPASSGARRRTVWLPAQRRGLEAQWHALRCAVYSPRPAPADDAPVEF